MQYLPRRRAVPKMSLLAELPRRDPHLAQRSRRATGNIHQGRSIHRALHLPRIHLARFDVDCSRTHPPGVRNLCRSNTEPGLSSRHFQTQVFSGNDLRDGLLVHMYDTFGCLLFLFHHPLIHGVIQAPFKAPGESASPPCFARALTSPKCLGILCGLFGGIASSSIKASCPLPLFRPFVQCAFPPGSAHNLANVRNYVRVRVA